MGAALAVFNGIKVIMVLYFLCLHQKILCLHPLPQVATPWPATYQPPWPPNTGTPPRSCSCSRNAHLTRRRRSCHVPPLRLPGGGPLVSSCYPQQFHVPGNFPRPTPQHCGLPTPQQAARACPHPMLLCQERHLQCPPGSPRGTQRGGRGNMP